MIWIYPKGFWFFLLAILSLLGTKLLFHFVFIGISCGRTSQPGKKPLIMSCWELPKQIKLNQALWNPKTLSYDQTRPDSKRPIRSASSRANQRPTLPWPNLIELVFELGGIERLLGRKAFSLLHLLTPGKTALLFPDEWAFCSGAELPKVREFLRELATMPQYFSRDVFSIHSKSQIKAGNRLTQYMFP